MDITTRTIAPAFRSISDNMKIFDLDALIKRLLLSETYILDSHGLTEIPYLLQTFTFDGLLAILESGALKLNCLPNNTGSLGPRPHFHYSFTKIEIVEINHHVNLLLETIEPNVNLTHRQTIRLRKAIYSSLENPQNKAESFSLQSTKSDLISSPALLNDAICLALKQKLGIEAHPKDIKISVHYEDENEFKTTSNLAKIYDLDKPTTHKIIESACLAIASCNDRIEQMKIFSALSGFTDIDLPIFGKKLEFLASHLSPTTGEKRFQRIIELTGLPQIGSENTQINAKQLLKIRQSNEVIEFRNWLTKTDEMSDAEIVNQVHSFSKAVGGIIGGNRGRNIRFLVTNGIGLIPPLSLLSIPLSIVDQFIMDKIFPRSGITAFVDDLYPSLFKV